MPEPDKDLTPAEALRAAEALASIELSKALGVPPRTVWATDGNSTCPDRLRTFAEGLDEIRTRSADIAKLVGMPASTPWITLMTELSHEAGSDA